MIKLLQLENITEAIFLNEENGWINSYGDKLDIGTWDRDSRIATLDNKIEQRGKLFIIEVNNATINGTGAVIGNTSVAINIVGKHDVNLKNFYNRKLRISYVYRVFTINFY